MNSVPERYQPLKASLAQGQLSALHRVRESTLAGCSAVHLRFLSGTMQYCRCSLTVGAFVFSIFLDRFALAQTVFGQRAGTFSWVPTETLLEELKVHSATEDLDRSFRFDSSEGDWSQLQTLALKFPRSKVLVLMTDSRKLPGEAFAANSLGTLPYWVSSVYINLLYALRYQHDFLRVTLPEEGLIRHPSWYKLQVIQVLLRRYEYLLYLDSDAIFLAQDRTVGSLVAEFDLSGSKHLLLPENGLCCDTANAGVMLWRHSHEAFKILKDWWLCPKDYPAGMTESFLSREHNWEQGCLERGGILAAYQDVIVLSNSSYLTTPEGTVIRHYWSTLPTEQRDHATQVAAAKIFLNEFRSWVMSDMQDSIPSLS